MFSTLKVYILYLESPAVGENFTYWCKYNQAVSNCTKFICKGEDPSICKPLVSTRDPNKNKRFRMDDNKEKKNIFITVREVTADDSGTYWCGAESTSEHQSNRFFNRLSLTVGESCISDIGIVVIIITGLVFLVLKDCTYEEIQERPQQPDQPENALTSIYVTASIPTDVAASPHYNSINFQSCSDKAGGEAMKRISSACEYSTLTLSKCPTNPTITIPSRPAEENLYSVINEPEPK
uniref:Immunoglobulin V-set domain-containing protein n=1 Tax=Oreochromis aureus TaxID=47969 RepID=A0AAZ1Y3Y1_OREAU